MSASSAKPEKVTVVIVEDQPHVLKNQLKVLQEPNEIEIIGTALSGEAALELLAERQPDVILQDIGLPRMSGIEVTREVKKRWPQVEVLWLARTGPEGRSTNDARTRPIMAQPT